MYTQIVKKLIFIIWISTIFAISAESQLAFAASARRVKGPMMTVGVMNDPTKVNSKLNSTHALAINEEYNKIGSPSNKSRQAGIDVAIEAFGLGSQFSTLMEEAAGFSFLNKLNNFAGELGYLFALRQFAVEIFDGKETEARLNLSKNLLLSSVGKLGWKGLKIANIGILFLDYSLTKMGQTIITSRDRKYEKRYAEFNRLHNSYRKTKAEWADFIVAAAEKEKDIKVIVEKELKKYLGDYFEDGVGVAVPDAIRINLIQHERQRIGKLLKISLISAQSKLKLNQKADIRKAVWRIRKLLNEKHQILVAVFGSDKKNVGLPVKVVVKSDQAKWRGNTDHGGQWRLNLTWMGYIAYGMPEWVEVNFKGKILRQKLKVNQLGFDTLHFYLPKDDVVASETNDTSSTPVDNSEVVNEVAVTEKPVSNIDKGGYWKFTHLEEKLRFNKSEKKKTWERIYEVSGSPGSAKARNVFEGTRGRTESRGSASWGDVPKVLTPGKLYEIKLQASYNMLQNDYNHLGSYSSLTVYQIKTVHRSVKIEKAHNRERCFESVPEQASANIKKSSVSSVAKVTAVSPGSFSPSSKDLNQFAIRVNATFGWGSYKVYYFYDWQANSK